MKCSPFLFDMLKLIERNLLQIKPAKRLKCPDIVKKLKEIHDKCKDPDYCTATQYEGRHVGVGRFFPASIRCCWSVTI
jgi:hypothetical protein